MCGANEDHGRNLQVHHAFYSKAFESPWEYPVETLYTMCELCHPQAEIIKKQIYERLAYLAPKFQHHVFYGIEELIEANMRGEKLDELEVPWAIKV